MMVFDDTYCRKWSWGFTILHRHPSPSRHRRRHHHRRHQTLLALHHRLRMIIESLGHLLHLGL